MFTFKIVDNFYNGYYGHFHKSLDARHDDNVNNEFPPQTIKEILKLMFLQRPLNIVLYDHLEVCGMGTKVFASSTWAHH